MSFQRKQRKTNRPSNGECQPPFGASWSSIRNGRDGFGH